MNVLVDTQILIWSLGNTSRLTATQKHILQDTDNRVMVSYASLMEIVIKKAVGKLPDFVPAIEEIITLWISNGFEVLPLSKKHLSAYNAIPFFKIHTDPFDRFIIAVGKAENCSIMTADKMFKLYKPFITLV